MKKHELEAAVARLEKRVKELEKQLAVLKPTPKPDFDPGGYGSDSYYDYAWENKLENPCTS